MNKNKLSFEKMGHVELKEYDTDILSTLVNPMNYNGEIPDHVHAIYFFQGSKKQNMELLEDMDISVGEFTKTGDLTLFSNVKESPSAEFFRINMYYQLMTPDYDDIELSKNILRDEIGEKMFFIMFKNHGKKYFEIYKSIVEKNKKRNFKILRFPHNNDKIK